ncbi:toxin-antitoxin system YwqK family antitoxin [Candidatus Woesearchaeota archaeon]|nr:toxin-antitoxin system YwqK family antitoxin [Candidatus Woesearchaeota archaeon]
MLHILLLVALVLVGCGEPEIATLTDDVSQSTIEEIPLNVDEEVVTLDELEVEGNEVTYVFPKEKIERLEVQKTITFEVSEDAVDGMVSYEFSGEGEYVAVFPKSFAAHVDDIEFSTNEYEVIEEDPEVKFFVDNVIKTVTAQVKNTALFEGGKATALAFADGKFGEAVDIGKNIGASVTLGEILVRLQDFEVTQELAACEKYDGLQKRACMFVIFAKYPHLFSEDICDSFTEGREIEPMTYACRAIMENNIKHCTDYQSKTSGREQELCNRYLWIRYAHLCSDLTGTQREMCMTAASVQAEHLSGCSEIRNQDLRGICRAMVSKDTKECQKVQSRELCCEQMGLSGKELSSCKGSTSSSNPYAPVPEPQGNGPIVEDELQDGELHEDAALEVIPEEQEAYAQFAEAGGCPTSVPAEAKRMDVPKALWFKASSGSQIGPYYKYYDTEKTQLQQVECWDGNGEKYGPQVYYNKDGTKKKEFSTDEDGEMHGTYKEWDDDTLISQRNYVHGKLDGEERTWYKTGQLTFIKSWKLGVQNGHWTEFWYHNGNKKMEIDYVDGEMNGVHITYHEDGTVDRYKEGYTVKGKFTGTQEWQGSTCEIVENEFVECE